MQAISLDMGVLLWGILVFCGMEEPVPALIHEGAESGAWAVGGLGHLLEHSRGGIVALGGENTYVGCQQKNEGAAAGVSLIAVDEERLTRLAARQGPLEEGVEHLRLEERERGIDHVEVEFPVVDQRQVAGILGIGLASDAAVARLGGVDDGVCRVGKAVEFAAGQDAREFGFHVVRRCAG